MSSNRHTQLDIGYRIFRLDPKDQIWDPNTRTYILDPTPRWLANPRSYGGERGVYSDIKSAQNSAKANSAIKGTYEIWKFHIGRPDSIVPWFPPEKVYG